MASGNQPESRGALLGSGRSVQPGLSCIRIIGFRDREILIMRIVLKVVEGPHDGREFVFDQHDNFIVGRAKFARFQLSTMDGAISRVHFLVEVNPPQCRLMDMGSTNGTYVNRKRVQAVDLKDGDSIKVGSETVIRVSLADVASTSSAEVPATAPVLDDRGGIFDEHTLAPPSSGPRGAPSFPPAPVSPPRTSPSPASTSLPETTRIPDHWEGTCPACGVTTHEGQAADSDVTTSPLSGLCSLCQAQAGKLPQPINGFRLLRELGHGGMGVVYLGVREADRALLALKTVQPAVAGSALQIERFLREARILEQLDHPKIVSFRAMDEANGLLYFAMDFVRGSDAYKLQKTHRGPLPISRAVNLTCQMLDGLAYAHARGFIHRDIKPANLLVERQKGREIARLTDFGLARTYQASQMSGLSMNGDLGGTMSYMAPEQITHFRDAKPPVDQYAAAATLYKFLTDRQIYDLPRQSHEQVLMILQAEPVPMLARRPDLPPMLADAVHRALSRVPGARFPDVASFRAALQPFLDWPI